MFGNASNVPIQNDCGTQKSRGLNEMNQYVNLV